MTALADFFDTYKQFNTDLVDLLAGLPAAHTRDIQRKIDFLDGLEGQEMLKRSMTDIFMQQGLAHVHMIEGRNDAFFDDSVYRDIELLSHIPFDQCWQNNDVFDKEAQDGVWNYISHLLRYSINAHKEMMPPPSTPTVATTTTTTAPPTATATATTFDTGQILDSMNHLNLPSDLKNDVMEFMADPENAERIGRLQQGNPDIMSQLSTLGGGDGGDGDDLAAIFGGIDIKKIMPGMNADLFKRISRIVDEMAQEQEGGAEALFMSLMMDPDELTSRIQEYDGDILGDLESTLDKKEAKTFVSQVSQKDAVANMIQRFMS